jgi:predicted Zn finger-like uncharacterized protein
MIVVCPSCQARYKFDEGKLGSRPKARTRCAKCGATIEIDNPLLGAETLPPGDMAPVPEPISAPDPAPPEHEDTLSTQKAIAVQGDDAGGRTITGVDAHKLGLLELPKNKRFSLAVIQGAATGQIYQITKTRTVIGRSGSDINVDDPECSRNHAALEILGDSAILRDLGSTNGTFIDLDRVDQQPLQNHTEFRIGSHVLMFIVTDLD